VKSLNCESYTKNKGQERMLMLKQKMDHKKLNMHLYTYAKFFVFLFANIKKHAFDIRGSHLLSSFCQKAGKCDNVVNFQSSS